MLIIVVFDHAIDYIVSVSICCSCCCRKKCFGGFFQIQLQYGSRSRENNENIGDYVFISMLYQSLCKNTILGHFFFFFKALIPFHWIKLFYNTHSTNIYLCVCMKVLELSADVRQKIPAEVDYEGTRKLLQDDSSPLNVVLLQEIQRYNTLLHTIRSVLVWNRGTDRD